MFSPANSDAAIEMIAVSDSIVLFLPPMAWLVIILWYMFVIIFYLNTIFYTFRYICSTNKIFAL